MAIKPKRVPRVPKKGFSLGHKKGLWRSEKLKNAKLKNHTLLYNLKIIYNNVFEGKNAIQSEYIRKLKNYINNLLNEIKVEKEKESELKEIDTTSKYDDKQHSSSEFYESLIECIIHEINKYNKEINLSNNNAGHNLLEIPEFFQMEIKNIKTCNEDIHQLYEKINFETHRMIRLKFIDYWTKAWVLHFRPEGPEVKDEALVLIALECGCPHIGKLKDLKNKGIFPNFSQDRKS